MRYTNPVIRKRLIIKYLSLFVVFFSLSLVPLKGWAQSEENVVDVLVDMGFENVGCTENEKERVYVLQNEAYRLNVSGLRKAIDVIQKDGLPQEKVCRIIVLDNNVPQLSLCYQPLSGDSATIAEYQDWTVSYDLGDAWKEVRKIKKKNSSLFKVDILVYPQLYFKNVIITQVYQACFELSPAVEVSLWKGSKLTAQVIFPVYNDGYGNEMKNIRLGYLTLEQQVRLPYNMWLKGVVGVFDSRTYGGEISLFHPFKDERFSVEGTLGLVGIGYFNDMSSFLYNGSKRWYWSVGGDFYWPQYNTQFKLRAEQYLQKEMGVKVEMIRHFRYCSIGFYAMKAQHAKSNGGFKLAVLLPPYKYKRRGYVPRISTSQATGISYNAGNEPKYYKMPFSTADKTIINESRFNPYYIKSELTK